MVENVQITILTSGLPIVYTVTIDSTFRLLIMFLQNLTTRLKEELISVVASLFILSGNNLLTSDAVYLLKFNLIIHPSPINKRFYYTIQHVFHRSLYMKAGVLHTLIMTNEN